MEPKLQQLKDRALDLVSSIFENTKFNEQDQINALEEIAAQCESNIDALKEQIKINQNHSVN